jgi:hypothetical protein
MKPLPVLLLAFCCLASTPAFSADSDRLTPEDYINLLRIDLRATKAQVVLDAMELTDEEAKVFWPIYRAYDAELSKLNASRISVIRDFTSNYGRIDDEKARDLSRRTFDYMKRRLELLERYSRKVDHELSPVVAARFAQLENHLLMLVDLQLASDMPLIPRHTVLARLPEE